MNTRIVPNSETKQGGVILAVGATGRATGSVVPALAGRGARVRGLIRKPDQAQGVLARGAAETAVGNLADRASVEATLQGVDAVFYVPPAALADEAEAGSIMVNAAVRAGVRRFVFSSVIHPVLSGLHNHAAKAPVEEAVLESGMEYTFLHPTVFYQNYAWSWPQITQTGVLAEPWSVQTRLSRVDYRDVAEAAAIALTTDRLLNGTFELAADGGLDREQVAALIAGVLGRDIKAVRLDPAVLGDIPPWMRKMFEYYDRHALLGNPLTLRAILGREPRTLRTYFEELAAGQPAAANPAH